MRILLAEDDAILQNAISRSLLQSGYVLSCFERGDEVLPAFSTQAFDLLILDLGLPVLDGLDILRQLRQSGNNVPVLVLTARGTIQDRISGLDEGADDYLIKPFALAELQARIRALIRRRYFDNQTRIVQGRIQFDTITRQAFCDGAFVELSKREVSILELLLINAGAVVHKKKILNHLYDSWDGLGTQNTVEVYIHRLRKKMYPYNLEIVTVKGMGYYLRETI